MAKKFNITGTCIPERHFMADISGKISRIKKMVDQGDYFTINRPRQFGKTTVMYLLRQQLLSEPDYLVLNLSFESIDSPTYDNHQRFIYTILDMMEQRLDILKETQWTAFLRKNKHISDFNNLSTCFRELVVQSGKKIVLMIDEVDKASNNQLFLDFLGMLRSKYLAANEGQDSTFHSVVLAGVHDIKTIKSKIRHGNRKMYNSPWNIAVDFKVPLELTSQEIAHMLEEYVKESRVQMDIPFISERLYYYTSGYPFLVSKLCKCMAEDLSPDGPLTEWNKKTIENAVQMVLKEDNTNFDSLIKNLENNPELHDFVFKQIMNGQTFSFNADNPVIRYGSIYGILKEQKGKTRIHNRLYEQRIYNYMASKLETSGEIEFDIVASRFALPNGHLHMEQVLKKFQSFMIEQYSTKDSDFLERNGRLLFLAFIKPIINGHGFDFKEVQISEEKRLDVVITFNNNKYIVELKLWRGEKYHREGIDQLVNYLSHQNETLGFLVIYDIRKECGKIGNWEEITKKGKTITAVWV